MKLPRHAERWFPGYARNRLRQWKAAPPGDVWLALTDHWEPFWMKPTVETARERVALWVREWPAIARRHADSAGKPPQYTFFYPEEEYREEFLDALAEMTRAGIGDVEVHLHHDREGEQNFVDRMSRYIETLVSRHGLLRQENGRTIFGFIHGNWALDNSMPGGLFCGLNNEITLLRELGCYADFTMPSGNSPSQASTVNTIYWATDDPLRPRSYDYGTPVRPGAPGTGDLLMIPGPLGLRWADRLLPRLENGELAHQDLATPYRVRRWLDLAPRIGRHIFLKLHTHGTQDRNSQALLGGGLDRLFELLGRECRERGHQLHFASAWQMRQAVDCAARTA